MPYACSILAFPRGKDPCENVAYTTYLTISRTVKGISRLAPSLFLVMGARVREIRDAGDAYTFSPASR